MSLNIPVEPRKNIDVILGDKHYSCRPPKAATAMRLVKGLDTSDIDATLAVLKKWLAHAFGPDQAKAIIGRLNDDNDDLDISHIVDLMTQTMASATGNPTT